MSEPIENIIAMGKKALESWREETIEGANRAFERALTNIEQLRRAGEKDIFKDAIALGIGDVCLPGGPSTPKVEPGVTVSFGYPINGHVTIVKGPGELTGRFKTMLVIYRDDDEDAASSKS